jgi:PAS domain-containing protein
MFKLVAVGGKIRGKEIELNEGENTLGRAPDNDHQLEVGGVSKKHMSITVTGDTCYVEDLGSSNGTFVNGKLIKKKTIKSGDKVALPNVIFQLVFVKEKKVVVKKKVAKASEDDGDDFDPLNEPMPTDFVGKIKYNFKHKVMPVVHSFNEQYEWNVLLGIFVFIFVVATIALNIGPVLFSTRNLLEEEVIIRGEQLGDEVSRMNAVALSKKSLDRVDTSFLDKMNGVSFYELFDLEGRVIRPSGSQNSYTNDAFSNFVREKVLEGEENLHKTHVKKMGGGVIGVGSAIKAYDTRTGRQEAVGIIAIQMAPQSLVQASALSRNAYLESLVTSAIVGVIFFGFIYYMTMRHFDEMRFQIENVLRGKQKELESKLMFKEIYPLRSTINSLLQRIKEAQDGGEGEFADLEDDAAYVRSLKEFMNGAQGPVVVLNSEKNIENVNPEAEDLLGMRESSSSGTSLVDSMKDQGLAGTIIDLCDQSANNEGCNQQGNYEIGGRDHLVNVVSLIGKDSFAKAFYITFVQDE